MKLIGLACATGVILVSGGCAESLTAPPAPVPTTVTPGPGPNQFVIRGPAHQEGGVPLIVVDGRVLRDNHEADQINSNQIERIDVLKGQAAVDRFGAPGANGVILITLKHG
jgi:TonB-dependent SusC/RagA subfamily outer membrane receptor